MSLRYLIKKLNAKFHLKYICVNCSTHKKRTRDILHNHKCFWVENWKQEQYEIPMHMGVLNYIRLYILKMPIKICLRGKTYKGAEV